MTFYVTPRSVEALLRFSRFSVLSDEFPQVYANGNMFYPCEIARIGEGVCRGMACCEMFQGKGRRRYSEETGSVIIFWRIA
jgi:hypothetical protein